MKKQVAAALAAFLIATGAAAASDHPPSQAQARKILNRIRPIAQQGNANAQYNMGVLYDDGYGVARDYATAMQWYKKAAAQHYAKAEHNLGMMYADGHGVAKNMDKAAYWFKRAANDGEPASENNLAVMYARGQGVPQNISKAALWAARAARAGNASAIANVPHIIADMKHVRISGNNVNIRAMPNMQAQVIRHAADGSRVVLLKQQNKWSQVLFPGDYAIGWVGNSLLGKKSASGTPTAASAQGTSQQAGGAQQQTVAAASGSPQPASGGASQAKAQNNSRHIAGTGVHVRGKPSIHAKILFRAHDGNKVTVVGQKHGWSHVHFTDGRTGWVASYLLGD
jgi:TPR repeat protein